MGITFPCQPVYGRQPQHPDLPLDWDLDQALATTASFPLEMLDSHALFASTYSTPTATTATATPQMSSEPWQVEPAHVGVPVAPPTVLPAQNAPAEGGPAPVEAAGEPRSRRRSCACQSCAAKKIRCDGVYPCGPCRRLGFACAGQRPKPRPTRNKVEKLLNQLAEAISEAPAFGLPPLTIACDQAEAIYAQLVAEETLHRAAVADALPPVPLQVTGPVEVLIPARRLGGRPTRSASFSVAQPGLRFHPYHHQQHAPAQSGSRAGNDVTGSVERASVGCSHVEGFAPAF